MNHSTNLPDDRVVQALRGGLVVAIPTDTIYGLAVCPAVPGATDRLFAVKQRPVDVALPVLVSGAHQATDLLAGGQANPVYEALIDRFWPGALTVVVKRNPTLGWDLGGDPSTIGLRCPASDALRRLCSVVGPMAVTSANRHGEAPLTTPYALREAFGDQIAAVVDGGELRGAPSTVVDITGPDPRCLREGALAWSEVLACIAR